MSEIPAELRYTRDHEWVREEDDGTLTVGVTDHAQQALGDLVFVELPDEGQESAAGDACAVVESVKAASDVYAPVAGTVAAVNETLEDQPELVNESPYAEGWLFRLQPADGREVEDLLDAESYTKLLEEEG